MQVPISDQDHDFGSYEPAVQPRKDMRSKLEKAKQKFPGKVINACPFDDDDGHLDERQYCHHLVGWTDPEDGINPKNLPRIYYPQKRRMETDPKTGVEREGVHVFTDGTDPQAIVAGDHLVLSRTCYRVYRNVPAPEKPPDPRTQLLAQPGVTVDN
jgi:hypothetical protein